MKFKCKHCGEEHEVEPKFCSGCGKAFEAEVTKTADNADTKTADLLGQIKGVVSDAVKGVTDKVKEVSDSLKTVTERVEAIEKRPAVGTPAIKIGSSEKYKGYKLGKQGTGKGQTALLGNSSLKSFVMKHKEDFEVIGTEEGFEGFSKFMIDAKDAMMGDVAAQQKLQSEQKASQLVEGTNSVGGYTVPVEYQDDLIRLAVEKSFALQECTTIPMSRETLPIPTELTRVSVNWPEEAAAPTESNPTFGQVMLTAKKLGGLTDGISKELLADSSVDIVGLLAEQFMYAIGLEIDNQALNGTGSPLSGVLTAKAGYSCIMSADAFSTVTAEDFSLMISKLSEEDATQAKFVYNRSIQHFVRSLKDTANNPIYQAIAMAGPGTIYGVPKIESSRSVSTSAASTAFAALGNWKKMFLGRRQGVMSLEMDPYSEFAEDLVRFKMITRWGMAVARATAFVRLVTGA